MRVRRLGPLTLLIFLAVPLAQAGEPEVPPGPDELTHASCIGPFEVSALDGPRDAHDEDHPSAAGLRKLIRHPGGIGPLGKKGWQLLDRTQTDAIYSRKKPPRTTMVRLGAQEDPAKPWQFESSIYECDPRRIRDGLGASDWHIKPERKPSAGDTRFKVLVTERACASGKPPEGRVLEPSISYRQDAVAVAYFVRPRRGGQTCPGAPPARETLTLSEPLGKRSLIDAGTVTDRPRFVP